MFFFLERCDVDAAQYCRHARSMLGDALILVNDGVPDPAFTIPVADAHRMRANVPGARRRELDVRSRKLRSTWERRIPPADGEVLLESGCTILAEPWLDEDAGTLVYQRRTNLAAFSVVVAGQQLDTSTWRVKGTRRALMPVDTAANEEALAQSKQAMQETVLAGLTFLEFAGFAAGGPAGMAGAAVASVLQSVLTKFLSPERRQLTPEQLEQSMRRIITKSLEANSRIERVEHDLTILKTYLRWFSNSYEAAWTQQEPSAEKSADALKAFRKTLDDALRPGDGGLPFVLEDLDQDSTRVAGLSVYIATAAFYLSLRKIAMLIDSVVDKCTIHDSIHYDLLLKESVQFADVVTASVAAGRQKLRERLARIRGPLRDDTRHPPMGGMPGWTSTTVYFVDEAISTERLGQEHVSDSSCCGPSRSPEDVVRERVSAYVKDAEKEFRQSFFFFEEEKYEQAAADMHKVHDTYKALPRAC